METPMVEAVAIVRILIARYRRWAGQPTRALSLATYTQTWQQTKKNQKGQLMTSLTD
jgi:hypothetical protein